jgi:hypothetical protein
MRGADSLGAPPSQRPYFNIVQKQRSDFAWSGMYCPSGRITLQRPTARKYRVRRTRWDWENKPRR